jgi:hypothetical protein
MVHGRNTRGLMHSRRADMQEDILALPLVGSQWFLEINEDSDGVQ